MVLATSFDTRVLAEFPGVALLLELALSYTPIPSSGQLSAGQSFCFPPADRQQCDATLSSPRDGAGLPRLYPAQHRVEEQIPPHCRQLQNPVTYKAICFWGLV